MYVLNSSLYYLLSVVHTKYIVNISHISTSIVNIYNIIFVQNTCAEHMHGCMLEVNIVLEIHTPDPWDLCK